MFLSAARFGLPYFLLYFGFCEGIPRVAVPPGSLPGTKILLIPAVPPLYTGDNVTEFLNLCSNGCTPECPLVYSASDTFSNCTAEDVAILKNLKKAKKTVRACVKALKNEYIETFVLYPAFVLIILMGGYLIQQKHFHYRTLYDWEYPDPTQGMPLWQYMKLKFAPVSVPDHRVQTISFP